MSQATPAICEISALSLQCTRDETSSVPKLAIIGSIEIAPGRRDQLLALLMAHRARCLKDESGTLQFEDLAPHEDETKVLVRSLSRRRRVRRASRWTVHSTVAGRDCRDDSEDLRHQMRTRELSAKAPRSYGVRSVR
jgi:hypothetical protein